MVRAPDHDGTMRALTPVALRQRSRSLRSVRVPSRHPVPNHVMQPERHVPCHLVPPVGPRGPDFAMDEQARHCTPPNRVRYPTGCRFASGCSPPRLAATQLPSATCTVTSHGTDSHYADIANSRTHSSPAKAGDPVTTDISNKQYPVVTGCPAFAGHECVREFAMSA